MKSEQTSKNRLSIGTWIGDKMIKIDEIEAVQKALLRIKRPLFLVEVEGKKAFAVGGIALVGGQPADDRKAWPLLAILPAISPEELGRLSFCRRHGLRFPYIAGAMANGISSVPMVEAMAHHGMLGFFGSAGLPLDEVEKAIWTLKKSLDSKPFGINLIHSPNEVSLEEGLVDLLLKSGVRLVSASAYLDLTPALIRYRVKGLHLDKNGNIIIPNKIIAKVSRLEVARKFFSPPPQKILDLLLQKGQITPQEAELATHIPVAHDLTAEADSGGHTDNRSAPVLWSMMLQLRDEMMAFYEGRETLHVGLAGGIGTPLAAASAFAMGADYIVTGSVNQASIEADTSPQVKELLAQAGQADIAMAPAADMFEMGVQVQVLKWKTLFATRARKLYDLYKNYRGLHELPKKDKLLLERDFFRASFEEVWEQTKNYFQANDPAQISRAERDPKHKMALIFRSYLGRASRWAKQGDPSRQMDYQIWCGAAMGAFNQWAQHSFFEAPEGREVALIALNFLVGAAYFSRLFFLQSQGISLPHYLTQFQPMKWKELEFLLADS